MLPVVNANSQQETAVPSIALLLQLSDVKLQGAAGWAIRPLPMLQLLVKHVLQVVVAAETQRAPILQTEGANVQPGNCQKLCTEAMC